jgi:acyl-CoA thioester hydrolase
MDNIEFHHEVPMQIRFNDVDKFGHVNNTVYYQFYDTAKTEYIATVCPHVDWEREAIIVVHIETDFISQIFGTCNIGVRTAVSKIGHKSFHLVQEVFDIDNNDTKSICTSVMVAYNLETHQTMDLPQSWVDAICKFEGKDLR